MEMALYKAVLIFVLGSFLPLPGKCTYIEPSSSSNIGIRTASIDASSVQGSPSVCVAGKTDLPSAVDVLNSQPEDSCNESNSLLDLPLGAKKNNSYIYIDQSNAKTCVFNHTVTTRSAPYTITFWIKTTCSTCDIFHLDTNKVRLNNWKLEVSGATITGSDLKSDSSWQHIAIRQEENGGSLYINGNQISNETLRNVPSSVTVIRFLSDITTGKLVLADFRYFNSYITDRQITELFSGIFPSSPTILQSDCRCPNYYPKVKVTDDDPSGLTCESYDKSDSRSRLNSLSHSPYLIIDGNSSTTWKSQNVTQASIQFVFSAVYMIDSINVIMNASTPSQTTIQLQVNGVLSNIKVFTKTSSLTWYLRQAISPGTSSKRSDVEKMVANSIDISFEGHENPNSNFFEVAEVEIIGRCYCNGNSNQCTLQGRTFGCKNCQSSIGVFCQECMTGRYRELEQFRCTRTCSCNRDGTKNSSLNTCAFNGGQCTCKNNVQGRACDACKPFTYDLLAGNEDGCMSCDCDQNGATSCDSRSGTCSCKPNVKPGKCDQCIDKYYGRHMANGCVPCNCDLKGVRSSVSCHETTGVCSCKPKVTGRQCDRCMDGFFNLSALTSSGCSACGCNNIGSTSKICDQTTGQCNCYTARNASLKCDPVFNGEIVPTFGPASGNTTVRLKGSLFGTNQSRVLVIIDKRNYKLTRLSDTELMFLTPASPVKTITINIRWSSVRYNVTSGGDFLKTFQFMYKPDPKVISVPAVSAFKSGGCSLVVEGAALSSVYQPRLIIYNSAGQEINRTACSSRNSGRQLVCKTPKVININRATYGFYFDGLTMYNNLTGMFTDQVITFISDPSVFTEFTIEKFRPVFDKTIQIEGKGFKSGCSESDYRVQLGQYGCRITSFTDTQIICEPEIDFPGPGEEVRLQVIIGDVVYDVKTVNLMYFWSTTEFIGIAIGASVFIILIVVLVIVIRCCRSRKSRIIQKNGVSKPRDIGLTSVQDNTPSDGTVVPERRHARPNSYTGVKLNKELWENFVHRINESVRKDIEFSKVEMMDIKLGNRCTKKGTDLRIIDGSFADDTGKVYAGKSACIKTLINNFDSFDMSKGLLPQWISNGIQECMKFRDCYDDNFLQIQGIAADEKKFYILYPGYERIFKEHLNNISQQYTVENLIQWCIQAANGLNFLHTDMNLIHKDLATRNCVITEKGTIKISDSAFAWNLYQEEYLYDEKREKYVPVRWMAIESLSSGFYDKSTDIWSFAVLIWEIMCLSRYLPYSDVTEDGKIQDHIQEGYRLGKSQDTTEALYTFLLSCWEHDSEQRPKIDQVLDKLCAVASGEPDEPDSVYMNDIELHEQSY